MTYLALAILIVLAVGVFLFYIGFKAEKKAKAQRIADDAKYKAEREQYKDRLYSAPTHQSPYAKGGYIKPTYSKPHKTEDISIVEPSSTDFWGYNDSLVTQTYDSSTNCDTSSSYDSGSTSSDSGSSNSSCD